MNMHEHEFLRLMDYAQRTTDALEKIERHLEKLANPMMIAHVPPATPNPVTLPPPGPVPPGTFEVTCQ